jgi:glycyl-tRNA synthetase
MGEMEDLIELAKRRGFFWQSFSIYGGFSGLYDYGPLGAIIKERVYRVWKDTYMGIGAIEIDSPSLTPEQVLKASGHVQRFLDMAVECTQCKTKFKVESLLDEKGIEAVPQTVDEAKKLMSGLELKCSRCGGKLGEPYEHHLMFRVDSTGEVKYLRPETAQGIFVNFRLLKNFNRDKLPMIVLQEGKGYRNEISPRQAIIRQKEFNMAEVEVFLDPDSQGIFQPTMNTIIVLHDMHGKNHEISIPEAVKTGIIKSVDHAFFLEITLRFALSIGLPIPRLRFRQHRKDELAHYSSDCWDLEALINGSWLEITGISDRGTYDLSRHHESSGEKMYIDGERFARVIEPATGIDRVIASLLVSSLSKRESGYSVLKLMPEMAPYPVAVLPLQKKDGLQEKALEIFQKLKLLEPYAYYDDSGAIGRRYARQDEIGTPYCITIDYETLEKNMVTIRERDSMEQIKEIPVDEILSTKGFLGNPVLNKFRK